MNIFCADIGGTNCRFAHFVLKNSNLHYIAQSTYPTVEICTYENTEAVLDFATASLGIVPQNMDFQLWGVAGIIEKIGRNPLAATLTNVALRLDFSPYPWLKYAENFALVNDFALQAFASLAQEVPRITLVATQTDGEKAHAPRVILGAGTGLGVATLIPVTNSSYTHNPHNTHNSHTTHFEILPAEGGHVDMSFYGSEEENFKDFAQQYLQKERISAEDILSGRGLQLLHAFVHGEEVSSKQAAQAMSLGDGMQGSVQIRLYARFLGRFCRHLALNTICTGGMYLGGGVLMKNPSIVQSSQFLEEFYNAPAHVLPLFKRIPMELMQHKDAALWGGAYLARQYLLRHRIS